MEISLFLQFFYGLEPLYEMFDRYDQLKRDYVEALPSGLLKKLFGEPNRMNDKEKLEAIKQVLSDTPARSGDDKETVAWYEKALDEIDKIIESNDTPTSLRYPK